MSQSCARWRGDIGAYIVGALGPVAVAELRRHMRACQGCRADYQELVPVRTWLSRFAPTDGTLARYLPVGGPPEPVRPRRPAVRRGLAVVAALAAVAAVIIGISVRAAPQGFHAVDATTGVSGWASLHATSTGTEISLTVTGLPANEHCTLVMVSPAGDDVAATWNAGYSGSAKITGASAIPIAQLTALRIETPTHRLLLKIPL